MSSSGRVGKLLQYHGGSPGNSQMLILAPTGVASINVNGATVHSALVLPCRGKLFSFRQQYVMSFQK